MSEKLSHLKCIPCRGGEPTVSDEEIGVLSQQIPDWKIIEINGEKRLQRVFKFKDFVLALSFSNAVGVIAEKQQHHPSILTEWGKVTVQWWTHVIKGLHKNDFIMAARTDELYNKS